MRRPPRPLPLSIRVHTVVTLKLFRGHGGVGVGGEFVQGSAHFLGLVIVLGEQVVPLLVVVRVRVRVGGIG